MEDIVAVNHQRYLKRKAVYSSFGYDVDKERAFIVAKARPFYGNILEAGTGKGHFALALAKAGYSFITPGGVKTKKLTRKESHSTFLRFATCPLNFSPAIE